MTKCNSCEKGEIDKLGSCNNCGYEPTLFEKIRYSEFFPFYVAGMALIINAIVNIIGSIGGEVDGDPFNSPRAHVTSIMIGGLLLYGSHKGLVWAKISIWAGLVLISGMHFYQNDIVTAILQGVWSCGLLILIYPEKTSSWLKRMATGYLIIIIALNVLFTFEISDNNILYGLSRDSQTEKIPGNTVALLDSSFVITLPNDSWKKRNDKIVKEENEDVNLWLTRPYEDLHLQVIIESVPLDYTFNLDVMSESIHGDLSQSIGAQNIDYLSEDTLSAVKHTIAKMSGYSNGFNVTFINGVYTYDNYLVQMNLFGRIEEMVKADSELFKLVKSISFDTSKLDTLDPRITGNNFYDPDAEYSDDETIES